MRPLAYIALLFTLVSSCFASQFKALLIGIDYRQATEYNPLSGAVNDARDWYTLLTTQLGVNPKDIQLLVEAQATRQGIIDAIQRLIRETGTGDRVFITYSGHGVAVPDPFDTQQNDPLKQHDKNAQTLAEAFAPYDVVMNRQQNTIKNLFFDTELQGFLAQLRDREVTLFIDACHSAGVTKDLFSAHHQTRTLALPNPAQTQAVIAPNQRGLRRTKVDKNAHWHPPYRLIAAAHYFQKAYEYPLNQGRNGALTYPVLALLGNNPGQSFTFRQVLAYSKRFIREKMGVRTQQQEPVFFGPEKSLDHVFLWPSQPKITSTPHHPTNPATPLAVSLAVQEQNQHIFSLQAAIQHSRFARLQQPADVVVKVSQNSLQLYDALGNALQRLKANPNALLEALDGRYLVKQLAELENPSAPFGVDLWLDQPGKDQFSTKDRVTLYYRVNGLPAGKTAYLTLLNVAPKGTISVLYPKRRDFVPGKGAQLYVTAPLQAGRVYSIPKTRKALPAGQAVGMDLRIRLDAGQEYFKAIISTKAMDWQNPSTNRFNAHYQQQAARDVLVRLKETIHQADTWAVGSLRVYVHKGK